MTTAGEGGEVDFARDIGPLLRDDDLDSMPSASDLAGCADVVEHVDAFVAFLCCARMPCAGVWPDSQVDELQQWIDVGIPG